MLTIGIKKHQVTSHFTLSNIQIKVKSGEIYALIGKSGSGKSTIATLLVGLKYDADYSIKIHSKELNDEFSSIISQARKKRGWNQATLGKRMAETVNVIKSAESGKHPTDSVIKKFERVLGITLMVDSKPEETSRLYKDNSRGLTLGDYFSQNGE